MLRRLLLAAALLGLIVSDASGQSHGLGFGPQPRLELLPVLLIPSDNTSITPEDIEQISQLAYGHLEVAQGRYKELLKTDSFKIADGDLIVFRSSYPHAHYLPASGNNVDAWRLAAREVMEWRGEDRFGAKYIYVIIYARPPDAARPYEGIPGMGYGLAFNGSPGSGGGAIVIELSAHLYETDPHVPGGRGQALLMHELGHAFGLRHVDCYGYNQSTDNGLMSYNWKINETKGPNPSRGIMNPEDYFVLSRNKLAFPNFDY